MTGPNRFKFTQAKIRDLKLTEGKVQEEYRDTEQRCFGLRVSATSKTFFVMARVNGKMTRVTVGRFSDKMPVEVARREAEKTLVKMHSGVNPNEERRQRERDSATLEKLFNDRLNTPKGQKIKETTRNFYVQTFNRHLSKLAGRRAKDITLEEATALHVAIGKKSPYAANAVIKILRGILSYQEAIDITYRNPLRGFSETVGLFEEMPRKDFIQNADLPTWYRAVKALHNDTARDYLLLLIFTGLRRNEGMRLAWENIDLEKKIITIPDTKNKLTHRLPIPSALMPMFQERQELYGEGRYVFPTSSKAGHLTTIQHVCKELTETEGVPDFQLHDLRRTFSNMAATLVPWKVVKWLLNHREKNDVTDRHYVTPDVDFLREPIEKTSQALLRAMTAEKGKVVDIKKAG